MPALPMCKQVEVSPQHGKAREVSSEATALGACTTQLENLVHFPGVALETKIELISRAEMTTEVNQLNFDI